MGKDEMPFEGSLLSRLRKDVTPMLARNGLPDVRGNQDRRIESES